MLKDLIQCCENSGIVIVHSNDKGVLTETAGFITIEGTRYKTECHGYFNDVLDLEAHLSLK